MHLLEYMIYIALHWLHTAHGKWEGWARKPVNHTDYMFHSWQFAILTKHHDCHLLSRLPITQLLGITTLLINNYLLGIQPTYLPTRATNLVTYYPQTRNTHTVTQNLLTLDTQLVTNTVTYYPLTRKTHTVTHYQLTNTVTYFPTY